MIDRDIPDLPDVTEEDTRYPIVHHQKYKLLRAYRNVGRDEHWPDVDKLVMCWLWDDAHYDPSEACWVACTARSRLAADCERNPSAISGALGRLLRRGVISRIPGTGRLGGGASRYRLTMPSATQAMPKVGGDGAP